MRMLHTRGLTRRFRAKKSTVDAVRGIDLDIDEGELVAFLGPNGAGKSTTLRMLTTLLPPTSGTAVVAGHDVAREPAAVRRRIGYIGQGNSAGHSQRVRDELLSQGRAYGFDRATTVARAEELLDMFELRTLADRTVESLSGGQRRRVDVALGLVHRPALLFLDEPSTGLDPQNRANLWGHVLRLRERFGTTMLLTTHYLDEADSMAERVLIIDHGRIIAAGTPDGLKADLAGDQVSLTAADTVDAGRIATVAERAARSAGERVSVEGVTLRLRVADGDALLPALLRQVDRDGIEVARAHVRRPTLDDVVLHLTGRSLREDTAAQVGTSATADTTEVAA